MNKYLLYFLCTVLIESAVLTGLKRWWYSKDEHSSEREWYRPEESSTSVRKQVYNKKSIMAFCSAQNEG